MIMSTFSKLLLIFSVFVLTSCEKTIVEPEPPILNTNTVISQNITTNTTWTNEYVYQLSGRISVTNGAILTIEPGTIIKGQEGTGANASALVISRGSKIIAEGTPTEPIIFTTVADEITVDDVKNGVFESPNLNETINGLWGGLIILGNAPISASNDVGNVSQVQIEGIPTSDQTGLYGGNDSNDSSGSLKYVSIRHGGANIGSGNEINGLTLGGVGNGTIIENIEIIANQDDGIEWFGGTVNVKNVVVWNSGDDAIDTDQSWGGTLENFIIITPQGHCFELDGPEGAFINTHNIRKGHVFTSNELFSSMDLINTDDNSFVNLEDIYFTNISQGQMINRVNHEIGEVTFNNIVLNVTNENLQNHVNGSVPQGISAGIISFVDFSEFDWTLAHQKGHLN
jgi:hypothetical protein